MADRPQTLKEFTDNTYAQGSFFWHYLLKNREIKVNGKKTGENVPLAAGDRVEYYLSPKQEEKPAFYIVYEDENVLVADKESGVNSEAVFAALSPGKGMLFSAPSGQEYAGTDGFRAQRGVGKRTFKSFSRKERGKNLSCRLLRNV